MTLHFNKMHFPFSHRYVMLTLVEIGRIKWDFGNDENVKVYVINNSIDIDILQTTFIQFFFISLTYVSLKTKLARRKIPVGFHRV